MNALVCTSLSAFLLLGCSEKDKARETGDPPPTDTAAASPPATSVEPTKTPALPVLPAAKALGCKTVVETFIQKFPREGEDVAERTSTMLATCESDWTAAYRECVHSSTSKHAPLTCQTTARDTECKLAVERLNDLAELTKKTDAALAANKDALVGACRELAPPARMCLLEATTLASYRECKDIAIFAELAASPELEWSLDGVNAWAWPAHDKGRGAERLSAQPVAIDSQLVRPVLRIRCNEDKVAVSLWAKVYLAEGKTPPKLKLDLQFDDAKAVSHNATIQMAEHIILSDPEAFLEGLKGRTSLTVKFSGPKKEPVAITFGVDAVEAVQTRLANCKA